MAKKALEKIKPSRSKKSQDVLENKAADKAKTTGSQFFLEHIKMTSFGKFANLIVGPFSPGMNVVFGPNEAGKTTLNELVKGVLFGWPAARGEANPYRPENAERSGSLFFRDSSSDEVTELKRIKNSDELNPPAPLLTNIDRETYETMFSLTSDELLRLDRHSDITARLLTAGSGTSSSPAHALEEINNRIKALTSRSAQVPNAIGNLKAEQIHARQQVNEGRKEADALREEEQLLASLRPRKEMMQDTQERLNKEIEELNQAAAHISSLDARIASLQQDHDEALQENSAANTAGAATPDDDIAELLTLTQSEEYQLRDTLDEFDERRAKLEHGVDKAREALNASQADFEFHMEEGRLQQNYTRAKKQRWVQLAFAVAVPVLMALIGLYIIDLARKTTGATYFMVGVVLVLVALLLAAVGIAISMRPTRTEEEWEDDRAKKEWVMQQDTKTLEVCERQAKEYAAVITSFLDEHGLKAALGSTRRARRLLDRAKEYRSACDLAAQAKKAHMVHLSSLARDIKKAQQDRQEVCLAIGLDAQAEVADVEQLIKRKSEERSKTALLIGETERQIGEITERLHSARKNNSFDEMKFQSETIEARLKDSYRDLAVLLLAKRTLEEAIAQWEKKSQPEVYRCASRLLSQMTDGLWQTVRMNAQGDIEVVDAIKTTRPPQLLSLGTRQQLYLSLRIALLMTAENVGRGLPIMCDDILVNFDDTRRIQAVRALLELAQKRQVILFTCHKDIATLVCGADSNSKLIEL